MSAAFLLDTCVISEFVKPQPSRRVVDWLNAQPADSVFLSVITVGELQRGISALAASARRKALEAWLRDALPAQFGGRILPLDAITMTVWGRSMADLRQRGKTVPVMDSLIAATALQHDLTLVTRNVSDFGAFALQIVDPWG